MFKHGYNYNNDTIISHNHIQHIISTNFWYYTTSDTTGPEAKLLDARALATAAEQAMENSPGVDGSGDGNDGIFRNGWVKSCITIPSSLPIIPIFMIFYDDVGDDGYHPIFMDVCIKSQKSQTL